MGRRWCPAVVLMALLLVAARGGFDATPTTEADDARSDSVPAVEVRQVTPADSELAEEWELQTDEPDVLGVDASRWKDETEWAWQVGAGAMEFLREDPLQSEVRAAVLGALRSVPGVTAAEEEDREVWVVNGSPSGEDLVRAVAEALAPFETRIRAEVEG